MIKKFDLAHNCIIGLLAISICCCLARHDFNVVGSCFLLLAIASYYDKKPTLVHKLIVQVLILLIIIDLIWMFIMSGVWSHEDDDKQYWKGLTTLHSFVWFLVICELGLTTFIIVLLFLDYKDKYGKVLNPINFDYKSEDKPLENQDQMMNNNY